MDGKPGPKYWQNRSRYTIKAGINPKTRRLSGEETVVYTNNSPDTLKMVRFKLSHDLYRKGVQRSLELSGADIDDGVQIAELRCNGVGVPADKQRRSNTFLDVRIDDKPLLPGSEIRFEVQWSYTLPADEGAPRECVCDSTTFFVPYWYPQIAVYDDLNGWASHPYTGQQEFYNDFSDYDVTITMPKGFMVWATGELQNAKSLFTEAIYDKWQKAQQSETVVSIWTEADLKKGGVFRDMPQYAFHYVAKDVPDFAFGSSDHYNWDALSLAPNSSTDLRTLVSAAYNSASKDYYKVAEIAHRGMKLMSSWQPGYPYPYPSMTVFNGNDGMEFPMMCNDASLGERDPTGLTVHEISHTYFPFMMGINEQDYAWMDEGWASFFDYLLTDSMTNHRGGGVRGYGTVAGTENDVPPMVRARNLGQAYRNASYQRPQAAYLVLLDHLGYEKFHACMTEYMNRWKGKHPAPFDFFNTWNAVSGENLDWFWKPWFFDWGYPDLGLKPLSMEGNAAVITVERIGNMPIPVQLEIMYEDGAKQTVHETAGVWKNGETKLKITCPAGKKVKSVALGAAAIPDADRKNNKI